MTIVQTVPPLLTDTMAITVDTAGGTVLARRADELLDTGVASITKLMVAWTARQWLDDTALDDTVTVGTTNNGPRLFDGDVISYRELLYAALVPSDNTAPPAIADNVGALILDAEDDETGDARARFVAEMNAEAGRLGYAGADFIGTVGSAIMTARQVADLLARCMADTELRTILSTGTYDLTVSGGPDPRTIPVVHTIVAQTPGIIGYVGGKTGTFGGRGHVAVVWQHPDTGHEFVTVVLNAPSSPSSARYDELAKVQTAVLAPDVAPPVPPPDGFETFAVAEIKTEVTWLACNLADGKAIAELRDVGGTISRSIGGYESTSLTLPIPSVGPRNATLPDRARLALSATIPARTMIVAVVNDVPTWAGIVVARKGGTDGTLTLSCVTPEGYLDRRRVRTHSFVQVDQNTIAAELVGDAEDIDGQGRGLGLVIDAPPSGRLRDRDYLASDRATVYQRLRELSAVRDGPEWTIDVDWQPDMQGRQVRLIFRVRDRLGIQASDEPRAVFETSARSVFASRGASDATYTFTEDFSDGRGANWVEAYAPGEGDDQPTSDPAIDTAALADGWPIYERHWQPSSSITTKSVLDDHATRDLDRLRGGAQTWRIVTRWDTYPRLNVDWALGDDAAWDLVGHLHPDGVVGQGRIIGWELDLSAGTVEPVLLDPTTLEA